MSPRCSVLQSSLPANLNEIGSALGFFFVNSGVFVIFGLRVRVCGRCHLIRSESMQYNFSIVKVFAVFCLSSECCDGEEQRQKSHQGFLLAQHDSCSSSNLREIKSDASRCITL